MMPTIANELLSDFTHWLEVSQGKGHLSSALARLEDIVSDVVKEGGILDRREVKRLIKLQGPDLRRAAQAKGDEDLLETW